MKRTLIFMTAVLFSTVLISNGYSMQKGEITSDNMTTKNVQQKLNYKDISPLAAKKLLSSNKKAILLDVRTNQEYEEIHIPGSMLIPLDQINTGAKKNLNNKNAIIIIYCRSGRRSVLAANELLEMGYKNIYNLGGIKDWPYEVEKDSPI
ncbi:MAG: hypothetical protein A2X42_09415 [Candidatus Margulisbacteria bacterium GWF2_38_17]|nr:MAG: hypothetical protein A2X42_09415 [Candidatus Margulisbacteria bacterium GWF2_38_17]